MTFKNGKRRFSPHPFFSPTEERQPSSPRPRRYRINFAEIDIFPKDALPSDGDHDLDSDLDETELDLPYRISKNPVASISQESGLHRKPKLSRSEVKARILEEPDWDEVSPEEAQRAAVRRTSFARDHVDR